MAPAIANNIRDGIGEGQRSEADITTPMEPLTNPTSSSVEASSSVWKSMKGLRGMGSSPKPSSRLWAALGQLRPVAFLAAPKSKIQFNGVGALAHPHKLHGAF